jgi:hypothetical protein
VSGDPRLSDLIVNNHKPILIVGNGPSIQHVNSDTLPRDYVVFRCNHFFLEPINKFKAITDGYFWSVKEKAILDGLNKSILGGRYSFGKAFYVNGYAESELAGYSRGLRDVLREGLDHWSIIASVPDLARYMMSRPLPTQGFQMLAVAAILGFRDIHLYGIDMYSSDVSRYYYNPPAGMVANLGKNHTLNPGYDKAHSVEGDLDFFNLICRSFDFNVTNYSKSSPLAQICRTKL